MAAEPDATPRGRRKPSGDGKAERRRDTHGGEGGWMGCGERERGGEDGNGEEVRLYKGFVGGGAMGPWSVASPGKLG
jgi:hypothetical protein